MSSTSLAAQLPKEMTELRSRPLMTLFLDIQPPFNLGKTPICERRIAIIASGSFEGERLKGRIMPSGSDWQVVRDDGAWMINVRTLLETDDGALIGLTYSGLRHGPSDVISAIARGESVSPLSYYMRVTAQFETSSEKYHWLNRIVSVAHGHRLPQGAIYSFFEIV
jgi:hypothetical protein